MALFVKDGPRPPMLSELVGAMVMNSVTLTDGAGGEIHALVVVVGRKAFAVYWERGDRRFAVVEIK